MTSTTTHSHNQTKDRLCEDQHENADTNNRNFGHHSFAAPTNQQTLSTKDDPKDGDTTQAHHEMCDKQYRNQHVGNPGTAQNAKDDIDEKSNAAPWKKLNNKRCRRKPAATILIDSDIFSTDDERPLCKLKCNASTTSRRDEPRVVSDRKSEKSTNSIPQRTGIICLARAWRATWSVHQYAPKSSW